MSDAATLFDRALRRLTSAWRDVAETITGAPEESLESQMRACLASRGGEVSARHRAAGLARVYLASDDTRRQDFLRLLASFDADPDAVAKASDAVRAAAGPAEWATATAALRRALEPPRVRLLTQLASIPDGCKFLVDLRAFQMRLRTDDPALAALEADLRGLLAAWFDVGFLELRRIDWHSPAALLEKLFDYEAVHTIRSWRDLKNRLDSDRRCYAFFHPRMPGEPLIFVEVALVQGLAGSIQTLLDEDAPVLDPRQADTAIFYSISNCQAGLAGISFGNFLIKRVVDELSAEFRNLRQFATLSPVPGFRRWLKEALKPDLLSQEETDALLAARQAADGPASLLAVLDTRDWWADSLLAQAATPVLTRLCAQYLLTAGQGQRARDPVAHFHLSNGARVERVIARADTSDKGARESGTLMVNYLYDPDRIEAYHEDYAGSGKRNASTAIRRLARGWG